MTSKQLASIRDSMQKIVDKYGDKLSSDTKADFHDTVNFMSNILHDVELERKKAKLPYVIYQLRVELN